MRLTRVNVVHVFISLLLAVRVFAQEDAAHTMVFHVLSVAYQDNPEGWCGAGTCIATKIVVKGSIKVAGESVPRIYKLNCIVVTPTPNSDPETRVTACPRLQANKNYGASFYGLHEIDFRAPFYPPEEQYKNRKFFYALFNIESESE